MNIDDNKLDLPLPFLDDVEKQAFRQTKCFRNLKTFQLLTDARRFTPFQIRITDEDCINPAYEFVETGCSGDVWELYDTDDNFICDLDLEYDFCDYLDYIWEDDVLWIRYLGDPLCTDLPIGLYYIKYTTANCELFSEVMNICTNPSLVTEWGNMGFDTFVSNDEAILSAIEVAPAGAAYCYTNPMWGVERGDVFTVMFCFNQNSGTRPYFEFYNNDGGGDLDDTDHYYPVDGMNILRLTAIRTPNPADPSRMRFRIAVAALTNFSVSDFLVFRGTDLFPLQDNLILEYTNSCNINNIYYEDGTRLEPYPEFMNKVVFQDKIDVTKPEYEVTKDAIPRDGYLLIQKVTTKKKYRFTLYAPEFFADAMALLPSHDTVYITDKHGDTGLAKEVDVVCTPTYHCFFKIEVSFYIDPVNSTNCCT